MALQVEEMLIRSAALLGCLLILTRPVLAQEGCEAYPDIPVNVTPVFDEAHYDYSASIPDIQNFIADKKHQVGESLALGVTHYEPMMEFRTPVQTVTYPDGLSCAQVQHVDVTIGYKNVTVYIAREVAPGSCGFDELMRHEQKHIAVNQEILREYIPLIQQKLGEYLRLNGVFREGNADYAVSLVQEKMQDILQDFGQQMMDENRERQKLIDTPAEYQRLSDVCHGQLARIAGQALQSMP